MKSTKKTQVVKKPKTRNSVERKLSVHVNTINRTGCKRRLKQYKKTVKMTVIIQHKRHEERQ